MNTIAGRDAYTLILHSVNSHRLFSTCVPNEDDLCCRNTGDNLVLCNGLHNSSVFDS